jgi:hypothetical protein
VNAFDPRRVWAWGFAWFFALLVMLTLVGTSAAAAEKAPQGALLPRESTDAGVFRGGLVYAHDCVTCLRSINARPKP